jgi:miniconductance mechanosensitive channel
MTFLVRQLASDEFGLPIEIYIFSSEQRWAQYEGIMADIFDHVFAVLPEFNLRAYQRPTGADFSA